MRAHPGAWLTSVRDAEPQESGSGLGCLFSCFLEGLAASLALQKWKPTVGMFQKVSFSRLDLTGIWGPCVPGATFQRFPDGPGEHGASPSSARPFSSPSTARNFPVTGQDRFPGICTKVHEDSSGRQERFTLGLQWLWVNKARHRAPSITRGPAGAPCAAHMPASRALCRLPFPQR